VKPPCLKIVPEDEYTTWFERNRDVLRSRSAFHDPAWLKVVREGLGIEVVFIGSYRGSELVAVLPGFLRRQGPFRLFGSHLRGTMTSYLGPIGLASRLSDDKIPHLLNTCSHFAREQWGVDYIEFTLLEAPIEEGQELGSGWEQETPGSYWLDLRKGEDALWSGLRGSCRRAIRKARRLEIQIVPLDDVDLYFRMLDATFARRGTVSPHPKQFFQVMLETLIPRDLLWAWGAEYDGRIIAGGLFLHNDREAHFLSGASLLTPEYRSVRANNLLHWHAIASAAQRGLRIYNLGGRGIHSIDRFKESFGPEMVNYWSVNWAPGYVRYAKKVYLASLPHLRRLQRWLKRS
jgi:hypothetical protein